jgi:hypothetical protein
MIRAWVGWAVVALSLSACVLEDPNGLRGGERGGGRDDEQNGGPGGDGTTPGGDPTQPGSCKEGAPHLGFGQANFVEDRKPGGIGSDRRRVKPYSVLRTEFQRVLGRVPPALAQSAPAFGESPPRWYAEPVAGAVSLSTTYSIAFTACFESMTGASFETAPTEASATAECTRLAQQAWQRTPTPDEVGACASFAVGLSTEPVARRRWAHACAAVMTAAGFTTY